MQAAALVLIRLNAWGKSPIRLTDAEIPIQLRIILTSGNSEFPT